MSSWSNVGLLAVLAAGSVLSSVAYSQQQDPATVLQLQEVVVTAQKRSETLSEVPATVQVLNPQSLQDLHVSSLEDVNRLVPGYQYEMGSGGNMTLSVRGIGTTSSAQSFEQVVSPYIDGVYLGGINRDFSWPLFDLQRVEVLMGSQSGIEGQNTSVGMVNLVTNEPGDHFGGYVSAADEFIDHGYSAEGAADVPVASNFRMRVSGYYNMRGGWIRNLVTGSNLGQQTLYAGRITAIWDITDKLSARFYGEFDHEKQIGTVASATEVDPTGGYTRYVAPYFAWAPNIPVTAIYGVNPDPSLGVAFGGDAGVLAHTAKGSATLNYHLDNGLTLTSITAGSTDNDRLSVDQDFSPAYLPTTASPAQAQWLSQSSNYHQITQELRLESPVTKPFSYIVGLWYRYANLDKTTDIFVLPKNAITGISWPFDQTTKNASVYGDAEYKVTDKVKVGGTLRYTREDKIGNIQGNSVFIANPVFPPFPLYNSDLRPRFVDGSVRVQYSPTDFVHLYALYSHGTTTGALVDLVASGRPQAVKPQVVQTYEVGAKAAISRSLFATLSIFHQKVHNYQNSYIAVVSAVPIFVASNTEMKGDGVDSELQWRATDNLTLGASAEYLNNRDTSDGGTFVRSPKWQWNANGRYRVSLGNNLQGAFFANGYYKGTYFNVPAGQATRYTTITPHYAMADVGFELDVSNGLQVTLVCKNCTNTYAWVRPNSGNFGPTSSNAFYMFLPELRTVRLTARYDF